MTSECKNVGKLGMLECWCFSFTGQETGSRRKRQQELIQLPDTSQVNDIRKQLQTQSFLIPAELHKSNHDKIYWNSFKKGCAGSKKYKNKSHFISRKTSSIVLWKRKKKERKNPRTVRTSGTPGHLSSRAASENPHGAVFPDASVISCFQCGKMLHKCFPNWCYRVEQLQHHSVTTWSGICSKGTAKDAKRDKKTGLSINGYQSHVQSEH